MSKLLVIFLLMFFSNTISQYTNFKLIRVTLKTTDDATLFLKRFPESQIDIFSGDGSLTTNGENDILFTPKQFENLTAHDKIKFNIKILDSNIQKNIDQEKLSMQQHAQRIQELTKNLKSQQEIDNIRFSTQEWFKSYHNYEENLSYVLNLKQRFSNMIDIEVIGKSFEGKDLYVLKIHSPGAYDPNKPGLWWNSVQHAREWATPSTGQWACLSFLEGYSNNQELKTILDKINIYYMPFVNPDGFKHSQSVRLWRKNRRGDGRSVWGVDLNRNWIDGFGGEGSSNDRNSETYRGTGPISEPESKAINDFLARNRNIKAGVDLHQYGQIILRPYGKSLQLPPDETRNLRIGSLMVNAIRSVNGLTYRNLRAREFWAAAGIMSDTFYTVHKMLGYTIEMRPPNASFHIPPEQLLPNAKENFQALLVLAREVAEGRV